MGATPASALGPLAGDPSSLSAPTPAVGIPAARVVTPGGVVGPAVVELDGGLIARVCAAPGTVPDRTIVPGFVDIQVNGHDDVDVATADGAGWDRLDRLLLAQGVTSWCPTLTTAPLETYGPALERIAAAGARAGGHDRPALVGVHLEGPFLGGRAGAHPPELLRDPDGEWLAALPALVRLVTLAPERPGALRAIARLAERDVVVALGHSSATHDEAAAAASAGARLVTHLFNAMEGLHHREPGLVGAALTDERLAVSLIADLVHVHPAALRLAFRAKGPDGVVLVTDAVAWRSGRVAGRSVEVRDGAPRLPDGTIAGSCLTMDAAVRNVVRAAGVDLTAAVAAASTVPARLLGLDDRGHIAPGARADLVALDPQLRVDATWVGGVQVHG